MRDTGVQKAQKLILCLLLVVHNGMRNVYDLDDELFLIVPGEFCELYLNVFGDF
jgi:hypothetical protein